MKKQKTNGEKKNRGFFFLIKRVSYHFPSHVVCAVRATAAAVR